ncbi:MAG: prolipoprotein diacylglyceryl transferase [Phycisphaerales bacterium]|nr:prolipoprotein diacylglyceryl transferase [Phycisphaerales bacterium]
MTATLGAWLHDLSPFALRISGSFGIRWYGLSYALGFFCAWLALRFLHKRGMALIPRERLTDAIIYAAMGAVVGGRLGYILFYQPELLWMFEKSPPFWGVLMLNHGGMASHGGMIGVLVAGILISRGGRTESGERVGKIPVLHVFDLYALVAPFGLMLGRIANFINGELLGKVVALPRQDAPWWAVRFPQEIGSGHDANLRTPEQDMALDNLIRDYSLPNQSPGEALELIIQKVQSGSTEVAQRLEPLLSARHPSQLYQAFAEGIVLGCVLWFIARRAHKPGVVTASFLICYGLLRIATELVRLPDPGVSGFAGLSRGQLLSAGMIVAGCAILVWVKRSNTQPISGWVKRAASDSASADRSA